MSSETKVAQSKTNEAFDPTFVKHDVRLETHGQSNEVTLYTNRWASTYEVGLSKGVPFFRLIGRERAYR